MKQTMLWALASIISLCSFAQAPKLGHISTNELLMAMPETKKAQEKVQKMQDSLNTAYGEMIKEYREKDSVIRLDSAKWTAAKKEIKFKEFQELGETLQNYSQGAQQYMQQKEQEMLEPIQRIAREAIQAVAKEKGYTYVFNAESLLVSPDSDDILPLVKKYLKIADKPATPIK
ncbi:MAG: OmpH family outer membrane protein [Bacteroidetes bacterium]|nr:OmpH family outer membrane protein [Bacteroidota bacterium]